MGEIADFPHEDLQLWKDSFGNDKSDAKIRERLKTALSSFRKKSAVLAGEIACEMPEYTVHGITHCDGLWKIADIIAGNEIKLNPVEAFVLGGAFLIHDLGMGMAAYDSKGEIEDMKEYQAACIGLSRKKYDTAEDEKNPVIDEEIKKEAAR